MSTHLRSSRCALSAAVVALALGAAGCSGGGETQGATTSTTPGTTATAVSGKVGVILPGTTAARWEALDRPYLQEAFAAAGVDVEIANAEGDRTKMATIADAMVADGAKVLVLVNLDSESGSAIQKKAAAAGVRSVDYDRLTNGGTAEAYVTFDDVQAGQLLADGLAKCLQERGVERPAVAVLDGPPADPAATKVAEGYDARLASRFDSGEWTLAGRQAVEDTGQAAPVFEQLLAGAGGRIDGVLAADDDLADAAIGVLQAKDLQVPVVGQGASLRGLRHVLAGDQCMTVLRSVKAEATAAAATAVALLSGSPPTATGTVDNGVSAVPLVLTPVSAVFREDVGRLVADGTVARDQLCAGDAARRCEDAGIG